MARIHWDLILQLLSRFPKGASLEELLLGLSPTIPRRTLQRWLQKGIQEGRLTTTGKTRSRRYHLPSRHPRISAKSPFPSLPLTTEALQIEAKISLPLEERKPVSYHRKFLEEYQPNRTYYLSENLRKKLRKIGQEVEGIYPAGTYARRIFPRLLIDLSWNSSRLEGNTYSLLETEALLERGTAPTDKGLKETQMILNHKAAIELLTSSAEEIGINRYTILNLHTLLSDNLLPDPAASGRLRSIPVGIAKSTYQPLAIPQMIEECFDLLLSKAAKIKDPIEQAFFLMAQLPYLQPFDDVNKRTSRLAANIPLIRNHLCPLSFIDVPEKIYIDALLSVYEFNRIELLRDVFAWAYERSCSLYSTTRKLLGEPDPFRMKYRKEIQYIIQKIVRSSLNKSKAIAAIRHYAEEALSPADRSSFIETVERELQGLHEGNIARYSLRPAEHAAWKTTWK